MLLLVLSRHGAAHERTTPHMSITVMLLVAGAIRICRVLCNLSATHEVRCVDRPQLLRSLHAVKVIKHPGRSLSVKLRIYHPDQHLTFLQRCHESSMLC